MPKRRAARHPHDITRRIGQCLGDRRQQLHAFGQAGHAGASLALVGSRQHAFEQVAPSFLVPRRPGGQAGQRRDACVRVQGQRDIEQGRDRPLRDVNKRRAMGAAVRRARSWPWRVGVEQCEPGHIGAHLDGRMELFDRHPVQQRTAIRRGQLGDVAERSLERRVRDDPLQSLAQSDGCDEVAIELAMHAPGRPRQRHDGRAAQPLDDLAQHAFGQGIERDAPGALGQGAVAGGMLRRLGIGVGCGDRFAG